MGRFVHGWYRTMTTNKTRAQFAQEWPLIHREDGCRVEIMCPHGVGHPVKALSRDWKDWMGVHGCDGCCNTAAFAIAEQLHNPTYRVANDVSETSLRSNR